jgi:uncharacterized repeat protein (TIGR04138 family)
MNFYEKVQEIVARQSRYKADAYEFVMQALLYTQKKSKRSGHLSGKELLKGMRAYALDQFGPMTLAVFQHWGIHTTDDIGAIVFTMVDNGLMSATEQDSPNDFKSVYNFREAFDVFKVAKRPRLAGKRAPAPKNDPQQKIQA